MAKLVFRLNGVSDEEANEVRALLDEHGFDTYETHAGRWGVSLAAIWVVNNDDKPAARALIDAYQAERSQRLRREREQAAAEGRLPGIVDRWRENPLGFLAAVGAIAVVAAISLVPFFRFVSGS